MIKFTKMRFLYKRIMLIWREVEKSPFKHKRNSPTQTFVRVGITYYERQSNHKLNIEIKEKTSDYEAQVKKV